MKNFCKNACLVMTFIALMGCSNGLIYSERTSLNLASVRVNDDPATPVSVKLGFDRDVVLVAPPIKGKGGASGPQSNSTTDPTPKGEAVSQFSSFSVNAGAPFVGSAATAGWQTWVHSRFASGRAALAIAGKPEAVAALMGLRVPPAEEQVAGALAELAPTQRDRLCEIAAVNFDDLTDPEIAEAEELSGFRSLYDAALHADVRRACEDRS